jgi:hypothetical protein
MTEQRQDNREVFETSLAVIDLESGVEFAGDVKNRSKHGLLFHAALEPALGADMQLTLEGRRASIQVVRVEPSGNGFDVAGRITARRR